MSKDQLPKWSYWLIGWWLYLRHPIKKPIDHAKACEILSSPEWGQALKKGGTLHVKD